MNRKKRIFFVAKLVFGIMLLIFAMLVVWQIVRLALLDYFFDIGFNVVIWLSLKISIILKATVFYGALALLICIPYLLKKNTAPDQNASTEK